MSRYDDKDQFLRGDLKPMINEFDLKRIEEIPKKENFETIYFKDLIFNKENKKEIIQIIENNLSSFKNSSNINPSLVGTRLPEVEVFTIDSETGVIRGSISQRENQDGLLSFLESFQRGTYFPILLDLNNPNQIMFGIGNNARLASGLPVSGDQTLIRNGGHQQLLSAYNKQRIAEGSNGIFGGGISLNSLGQIQVEFKSRSLNSGKAGVVDGQISDDQEAVLRELVLSILRKAQDKVDANLVAS